MSDNNLPLIYNFNPDVITITPEMSNWVENEVTFTIANPIGEDPITFSAPDNAIPSNTLPVYNADGDNGFPDLSRFYFWFPYGLYNDDLTTVEQARKITVAPKEADDWAVENMNYQSGNPYWMIYPTKTTILKGGGQISFTISGIKTPSQTGVSRIHIGYCNIAGYYNVPYSKQFSSVVIGPGLTKKIPGASTMGLVYDFSPGQIYVTEDSKKPIENSVIFSIANPKGRPVVQFNKKNGTDVSSSSQFKIWFPWGSGTGDLAENPYQPKKKNTPSDSSGSDESGNIHIDLLDSINSNWETPVPMGDAAIGRYWILYPKNDCVLNPGESISFEISGIKTTAALGMTYMYIECKNIEGFQDGYLTPFPTLNKLTPPLEIAFFKTSKSVVKPGKSALLTWKAEKAHYCTISPPVDPSDPNKEYPANDATGVTVTPDVSTTYTLTAHGLGDVQISQAVTVTISPLEITSFASSENSILPGDSATLTWTTDSADYCTISPPLDLSDPNKHYSGNEEGGISISPSVTTVYTLTAYQGNTSLAKSITVNVETPDITLFESLPSRVPQYGVTQLKWDTQYAESCTLNPGNISLDSSGVHFLQLSSSQVYTLTIVGKNGIQKEQSVSVLVDTSLATNQPVEKHIAADGQNGTAPQENGSPGGSIDTITRSLDKSNLTGFYIRGGNGGNGGNGINNTNNYNKLCGGFGGLGGDCNCLKLTLPPPSVDPNCRNVYEISSIGGNGGNGGRPGNSELLSMFGDGTGRAGFGGEGGYGGDIYITFDTSLEPADGNYIITTRAGVGGINGGGGRTGSQGTGSITITSK